MNLGFAVVDDDLHDICAPSVGGDDDARVVD